MDVEKDESMPAQDKEKQQQVTFEVEKVGEKETGKAGTLAPSCDEAGTVADTEYDAISDNGTNASESASAQNEGSEHSVGKRRKRKKRTPKKHTADEKSAISGQEESESGAETGPESASRKRKPKQKSMQSVQLDQFQNDDEYSEVSDYDEETDGPNKPLKSRVVNGKLIMGPNKDTSGRFYGPQADVERFGMESPLPDKSLVMIYDPYNKYEALAFTRPGGPIQIEGIEGYFYPVKMVSSDGKKYHVYRKLLFHESILVKHIDTPRDRPDRRAIPKGFGSFPGSPAFNNFRDGYIFYYHGQCSRSLMTVHHHQLYLATDTNQVGIELSDDYSVKAVYFEEVDELTQGAHLMARTWMEKDQKRKNSARKKKEQAMAVVAERTPSIAHSGVTDSSTGQRKLLIRRPIDPKTGKSASDAFQPGGSSSQIDTPTIPTTDKYFHDVDEYNQLIEEKERLQKEVEKLKALLAGRDTIAYMVSDLKRHLPSADLLTGINGLLESISTIGLKDTFSTVAEKLSDVPSNTEFQELTVMLKKAFDGELIKNTLEQMKSIGENAETIQKCLKAVMTQAQQIQHLTAEAADEAIDGVLSLPTANVGPEIGHIAIVPEVVPADSGVGLSQDTGGVGLSQDTGSSSMRPQVATSFLSPVILDDVSSNVPVPHLLSPELMPSDSDKSSLLKSIVQKARKTVKLIDRPPPMKEAVVQLSREESIPVKLTDDYINENSRGFRMLQAANREKSSTELVESLINDARKHFSRGVSIKAPPSIRNIENFVDNSSLFRGKPFKRFFRDLSDIIEDDFEEDSIEEMAAKRMFWCYVPIDVMGDDEVLTAFEAFHMYSEEADNDPFVRPSYILIKDFIPKLKSQKTIYKEPTLQSIRDKQRERRMSDKPLQESTTEEVDQSKKSSVTPSGPKEALDDKSSSKTPAKEPKKIQPASSMKVVPKQAFRGAKSAVKSKTEELKERYDLSLAAALKKRQGLTKDKRKTEKEEDMQPAVQEPASPTESSKKTKRGQLKLQLKQPKLPTSGKPGPSSGRKRKRKSDSDSNSSDDSDGEEPAKKTVHKRAKHDADDDGDSFVQQYVTYKGVHYEVVVQPDGSTIMKPASVKPEPTESGDESRDDVVAQDTPAEIAETDGFLSERLEEEELSDIKTKARKKYIRRGYGKGGKVKFGFLIGCRIIAEKSGPEGLGHYYCVISQNNPRPVGDGHADFTQDKVKDDMLKLTTSIVGLNNSRYKVQMDKLRKKGLIYYHLIKLLVRVSEVSMRDLKNLPKLCLQHVSNAYNMKKYRTKDKMDPTEKTRATDSTTTEKRGQKGQEDVEEEEQNEVEEEDVEEEEQNEVEEENVEMEKAPPDPVVYAEERVAKHLYPFRRNHIADESLHSLLGAWVDETPEGYDSDESTVDDDMVMQQVGKPGEGKKRGDDSEDDSD